MLEHYLLPINKLPSVGFQRKNEFMNQLNIRLGVARLVGVFKVRSNVYNITRFLLQRCKFNGSYVKTV